MKNLYIILLSVFVFGIFSCNILNQLNHPVDPCNWGVIPYDSMGIFGYRQSVGISSWPANDTTKELLAFWPDNRYYWRKTCSTGYYLEEYGYFSRNRFDKYGIEFRTRNKFSISFDTAGHYDSLRRYLIDSIRIDTVDYAKSDTAGLPVYIERFYRNDTNDQGMTKFYTQNCGEPGCVCPYLICTYKRVDSSSVLNSMWVKIQKTF